jgi:hypothetical protein
LYKDKDSSRLVVAPRLSSCQCAFRLKIDRQARCCVTLRSIVQSVLLYRSNTLVNLPVPVDRQTPQNNQQQQQTTR